MRRWLLLGTLGIVGFLAAPTIAEACGGFFRRVTITGVSAPSLSHEQVLLIYDAARARQHFIREVAFRNGSEPFGFVVPVPARPEVAAVAKSPFASLRAAMPTDDFGLDDKPSDNSDNKEGGTGARPRRAGAGVTVLETAKIGSFTAFVLAASNAQEFATWLGENGLVSTPSTDEWLAHYVRLKFFYVALRYEPPAPKAAQGGPAVATPASVVAETLRISFSTPVPYYPYLEPKAAHGAPRASERLLDLWLVSTKHWTPIATVTTADGRASWVRPFRPNAWHDWRYYLDAALDQELRALLPAGELSIQTFQDQKGSRAGFGDVLFAAAQPAASATEQLAPIEPLLGILDPALLPDTGATP